MTRPKRRPRLTLAVIVIYNEGVTARPPRQRTSGRLLKPNTD